MPFWRPDSVSWLPEAPAVCHAPPSRRNSQEVTGLSLSPGATSTSSAPSSALTVLMDGASGTSLGTMPSAMTDDAGPVPTPFTAATLNQ